MHTLVGMAMVAVIETQELMLHHVQLFYASRWCKKWTTHSEDWAAHQVAERDSLGMVVGVDVGHEGHLCGVGGTEAPLPEHSRAIPQ